MSQNLGVYTLNPGGTTAINGITAAQAVKSSASSPAQPGKLRRLSIIAPGSTSGAFTFYDTNFIGAYSSGTQYQPGQGVTSGGTVYTCIAATLGNAPPNATYWVVAPAILTVPYNSTLNIAGSVINADWPCANGIYLGAVPGAGSPVVNVSFD